MENRELTEEEILQENCKNIAKILKVRAKDFYTNKIQYCIENVKDKNNNSLGKITIIWNE